MAKTKKGSSKMILTGYDLSKGATTDKKGLFNALLQTTPWQMLEMDEKTEEWKKWNADHFEWLGWNIVNRKQKRYIKNRMLSAGLLDINDYMIQSGGEAGEFAKMASWSLAPETADPLKKPYPLIPPFVKVLEGEFLKRDLQFQVTCIDRFTEVEKLEYKQNMVDEALVALAIQKKQQALAKMGFTEEAISQAPLEQQQEMMGQMQSEMQAAQKLAEAENKFKKYRTSFENLGQHLLNKDYGRFRMAELEREQFLESLNNDEVMFELQMKDDHAIPRSIDCSSAFWHNSEHVKYASQGDYIGYFTDMTIGDVLNEHGDELSEDDYANLKSVIDNSSNAAPNGAILLADHEKNWQGAYYDTNKGGIQGKTNLGMNEYREYETWNSIFNSIQNWSSSELLDHVSRASGKSFQPKQFRRLTLYWKTFRKIGFLTKKDRGGNIVFSDWIDENFKVTVFPVYDNTLTKAKMSTNLVYGEHIDWEWTNEWRKIIKLSLSHTSPIWKSHAAGFEPIYIGGDPIPFQFTGKGINKFKVLPPVEAVIFKQRGIRNVSFVELLEPSQFTYNIAMNKVPDIMFNDTGLTLALNKMAMGFDRPGIDGGNARQEFMQNMRENKVVEVNVDRELLQQQGNSVPVLPTVLNTSRIAEAIQYMNLANGIWQHAGRVIGINEQRMAQAKPSETATGVTSNIEYSETQTEPYFHRFIVEFMPRVYERMLDAAQYYCTKTESARAYYQTTDGENMLLNIENMDNLARDYNIFVKSDIRERSMAQAINNLIQTNNTNDGNYLEMAEAISRVGVTDKLESLRKSQIRREQSIIEQREHESSLQQAQEQAAIEAQKAKQEFELIKLQMTLDSQERQAQTRAVGGLQTDVDENDQLDAYENVTSLIKQQQINDAASQAREKLNYMRNKDMNDERFRRDQLSSKERVENKKLAVALANTNSSDDKKLNRKIAKDQKVVK